MQIHGLHQSQASQSVNAANSSRSVAHSQSTDAAAHTGQADQLDLSPEALALSRSQAAQSGGIRMEKVAALRQAIADGTYETTEKMSAALDKMLDTFA